MSLLTVENLTVRYKTMPAPCVNTVSLKIEAGKSLGLIGGSGCGKTTLARAVIGALPASGAVVGGTVSFRGKNLLDMDKSALKTIQGRGIGMIAQQSLSSLNPVRRAGAQFVRLLGEKAGICKADAIRTAADFLERVSCPADILNRYPFQLSGGQRQRVLIAMAFALRPALLIADEPTTALDAPTAAQVLREITRLRDDLGAALLLISHNLAVVSQVCDDIAVMHNGAIVECGNSQTLLGAPSHPYTKGLIGCIPHLDTDRNKRLYAFSDEGALSACWR